MAEHNFIIEAAIVLAAAIVGVVLAERLKLGSVLGYLVAGLVIGPAGFAFITDVEATRTLAELGVVFLLFMVGLELPLERIRVMPPVIFLLGGGQILLTGALIAGIVVAFGGRASAAVVVGGALALSSTAIVLRLLSDRHELNSRFGRAAFGILIMQDLVVGPLIVGVLALGQGPNSVATALGLAFVKAILAMALILGVGRLALRPIFAPVAAARRPEIFAALTLLVVLAAGIATQAAGLSMAFGALLAGMLVAESPYRHQVAVEIQPFRGLLLGLFFISVGMSLDTAVLRQQIATVLPLTLALIVGKSIIIAGLARLVMLPTGQALRLGLLLSQGGEFAFVLLGVGFGERILSLDDRQQLVVIVILSMMLTPLLAEAGRFLAPRIERRTYGRSEAAAPEIAGLKDHVIIAGYGRVGRAVAQRLTAAGITWVALDLDPHRVTQARRQGLQVHFGDADRPEILEAFAVEQARAVVVAVDNPKVALQLTALLHYVLPAVPILARAYDEAHAAELERAGAAHVIPEPAPIGAKIASLILESRDQPPA
ncbi:MAG TPA: cation:proton antiporter [Candidatus Angelobacter sp.]|nr:cation:proton antiporter [Candidatus Angelobacter sp.]